MLNSKIYKYIISILLVYYKKIQFSGTTRQELHNVRQRNIALQAKVEELEQKISQLQNELHRLKPDRNIAQEGLVSF